MRFTFVATGQFSLGRAFGFSLTASSLTQLSVVNSPIRPEGLIPAWLPASPAHTKNPQRKLTGVTGVGSSAVILPFKPLLVCANIRVTGGEV